MLVAATPRSFSLHLHHVPAGCRLDFPPLPGCFAYVYRRCRQRAWQCVAHNACSPHIDRFAPPLDAQPEYVVCYCDAAGTIVAATPIAQTHPHSLPAPQSWMQLSAA